MQKHKGDFCSALLQVARTERFFSIFTTHKGGRWRYHPTPLVVFFFILIGVVAHPGTVKAFTESVDNNFFGANAGSSITSGNINAFFGGSSGVATTTGALNSFFGDRTGFANTTGSYNAFFGGYSGYYNTIGSYNSSFGGYSGYFNTSGSANSFFGHYSGGHNTVENLNTFIGFTADLNPGSDPVTNATAIGARSIVAQSNSLVLGSIKGLNSATANVNVGIGTPSPQRQLHITGDNAVFRMDRPTDTVGFMLVRTDLYGNPLKTFLVGANASGTNTGELVVNDMGTAVGGAGIRRMTIANNGSVQFTGAVTAATYYAASSMALKDNVRTYEHAVETVNRLRGVRFDWKDSGQPAVGLIAEEVEKVVPEVVTHEEDGKASGVNYASLVGMLVEAVKEQEAKIGQQQATIATQQAEINVQRSSLAVQLSKLKNQDAKLMDHQEKLTALQSTVQHQELVMDEYRETLARQQQALIRLAAQGSGVRQQEILAHY